MLPPLIILEQHLGADARDFIAHNAQLLRDMGYIKLCLEMDRNISKELVKLQCNRIINSKNAPEVLKEPTKALYKLLIELEKYGIECEFIDPEPQKEAARQNAVLNLASKISKDVYKQAERNRQQINDARDDIMSQKVIEECDIYHGGIIFLGGFLHQKLVSTLNKSNKNCQFYMFANSDKEEKVSCVEPHSFDEYSWRNFYNHGTRQKYYNAEVSHFDMAAENHLSFESILLNSNIAAMKEFKSVDNTQSRNECFNKSRCTSNSYFFRSKQAHHRFEQHKPDFYPSKNTNVGAEASIL